MRNKFLYIARHGHAEQYKYGKTDYSRKLTNEGIQKIQTTAEHLAHCLEDSENLLLVASPALRSKETCEIYARVLHVPEENIIWNKTIYEASVHNLMEVISRIEEHIQTVVLVGHNPGLSQLCDYLCDRPTSLKPGEIAAISLPDDFHFHMLTKGLGTLRHVIE